jgi:hypothetical protein
MKFLLGFALLIAVVLLGLHGHPHALLAIAFVPAWVGAGPDIAGQNMMTAYTLPSGILTGPNPTGMVIDGVDPTLGMGQFVYGQAGGTIAAGNVVQPSQSLLSSGASISVLQTWVNWTGTTIISTPLAVALVAMTIGQFGWFQVFGPALINTSAAVAVGASAYWNAAGVVQSGAVASKQMGATSCIVASSASLGQAVQGVTPALTSTQGIYFLQWPESQGAIT